MIKTTGRSALLILILAVAGLPPTLAQTDTDEAPRASEDLEDLEDLARQPAGRSAATPAAPLEDYEASEQISEDLSVSFPVDI